MKATPSALFETLSGQHKDLVMRDTQYGTVVAPLVIPANPQTDDQTNVRTAFTQAAQRWGSTALDDSDRAAWAILAGSDSRTDKNGRTYKLTGFQEYVSVNALRIGTLGIAALDTAPGVLPEITAPTGLAVTYNGTSHNFEVSALDEDPFPEYIAIYATHPLLPGRKPQDTSYRFVQLVPSAFQISHGNFAIDALNAEMGVTVASLASGTHVGLRFVPIDPEGFAGTPVDILATRP